MEDIHSDVCGHHAAPKTLVGNAFHQGFYWRTAVGDATHIVRSCQGCQFYAGQTHLPVQALQTIPPTWPFTVCGAVIVCFLRFFLKARRVPLTRRAFRCGAEDAADSPSSPRARLVSGIARPLPVEGDAGGGVGTGEHSLTQGGWNRRRFDGRRWWCRHAHRLLGGWLCSGVYTREHHGNIGKPLPRWLRPWRRFGLRPWLRRRPWLWLRLRVTPRNLQTYIKFKICD